MFLFSSSPVDYFMQAYVAVLFVCFVFWFLTYKCLRADTFAFMAGCGYVSLSYPRSQVAVSFSCVIIYAEKLLGLHFV